MGLRALNTQDLIAPGTPLTVDVDVGCLGLCPADTEIASAFERTRFEIQDVQTRLFRGYRLVGRLIPGVGTEMKVSQFVQFVKQVFSLDVPKVFTVSVQLPVYEGHPGESEGALGELARSTVGQVVNAVFRSVPVTVWILAALAAVVILAGPAIAAAAVRR